MADPDESVASIRIGATLADKDKRKAEVRARLEATTASTKKTKFMTPARKKKLRNLIRQLAAEELKKEQERKAEERRIILAERTGAPKDIENANEAELQAIAKEYTDRINKLIADKYDMEYVTSKNEYLKADLTAKVKYVKGKLPFKPALKKVSKAQAQMEKIKMFAAKANQMDARLALKSVKKHEAEQHEEKTEKPEWADLKHSKSVVSENEEN